MKKPIFGNMLTAMITPFDKDLKLNINAAEKVVDHLISTGTEAIVVAGTTGESPTLTHDEEFTLFKEALKMAQGKIKIIAGTGSNSTETAVASTKEAQEIGVDGAMIVVPYYNKPSQEGMYQHFKKIADNTDLPLIIYNIPGRTGVNMEPSTVARLAEVKNYIAVKEASGNIDQVAKIREITPSDFIIYSGDDNMTLPIMEKGGAGVISVASHVAGLMIKEMIDKYIEGNTDEAKIIDKKLADLFKVLFITTNPTPVKAAMNILGFDAGKPRLPLIDATDEEKEKIKKTMKELGLL